MRGEWIIPRLERLLLGVLTVLLGIAVLDGITYADNGGITWFDLITEDLWPAAIEVDDVDTCVKAAKKAGGPIAMPLDPGFDF